MSLNPLVVPSGLATLTRSTVMCRGQTTRMASDAFPCPTRPMKLYTVYGVDVGCWKDHLLFATNVSVAIKISWGGLSRPWLCIVRKCGDFNITSDGIFSVVCQFGKLSHNLFSAPFLKIILHCYHLMFDCSPFLVYCKPS